MFIQDTSTRYTHIMAVCVLFAIFVHLPDTLRPYQPGVDEGFMMQAVNRAWEGNGLAASLGDSFTDLSQVEYHHLYQWPPGYCFFVYALMLMGITQAWAIKLIDLLAIGIGNLGWLLLARHYLKRRFFIVFGCALILVFRGSTSGATDLIFWSLMPFWLLFLRKGLLACQERETPKWWLFGGLLASLSIAFRFAAGYLIMAGGLFALVLTPGSFGKRFLRSVQLSLIPLCTMIAIFYWNSLYSQSASYLNTTETIWTLHRLSLNYPTQALLAEFWGTKQAMSRLITALGSNIQWAPWMLLSIGIAALGFAGFRQLRDLQSQTFCFTMGFAWLSLVFYLSILTIAYSGIEFGNWTYLQEPRFYNHQLPAFAIAWLVLIQAIDFKNLAPLNNSIWRIAPIGLLLGFMLCWTYSFQGFLRGSLGEGARVPSVNEEIKTFLTEHINANSMNNYRILGPEVNFLVWNDTFRASRFAPKENLLLSQCSAPIFVYIIWPPPIRERAKSEENNRKDPLPFYPHLNPELPEFYIHKLNLSRLYTIPATHVHIFGGWVRAYPRGYLADKSL